VDLNHAVGLQSKASNVTLLHFIVRTYTAVRGGALAEACALPVPEPGDVARAAALDFADVGAALATLRAHHAGNASHSPLLNRPQFNL
jgi:hypothetical protein